MDEHPTTPGLVRFPPRKSFVAVATDFVRVYCAELAPDAETLSRLTLVAHEMAENVVKYSSGGSCTLQSTMNGSRDGHASLCLTTTNEATSEQLKTAAAYLNELEQAADAERFYDDQIAESAKRQVGSGLGLARIRAEGMMTIRHEIDGHAIHVSAEARLDTVRSGGKR